MSGNQGGAVQKTPRCCSPVLPLPGLQVVHEGDSPFFEANAQGQPVDVSDPVVRC